MPPGASPPIPEVSGLLGPLTQGRSPRPLRVEAPRGLPRGCRYLTISSRRSATSPPTCLGSSAALLYVASLKPRSLGRVVAGSQLAQARPRPADNLLAA